MQFKKNYHRAKGCRLQKINKMIENYPSKFPTPKYLIFIKTMIENGWRVKLLKIKVSKYVFVLKNEKIFKIRFSNHKPIHYKELENDCDFYVGISHEQVTTTEQLIKKLTQ